MTESLFSPESAPNWWLKFIRSPKRCHAVSGSIACALIALTTWMYLKGDSIFQDDTHSSFKIAESVRLVSESSDLQTQHQKELMFAERNEREVAGIREWLPTKVDWKESKQAIKQLGKASGVQLFSVERKADHTGYRVNVISAKCEMNGTYEQICQFIHSLTNATTPIWCDSIDLKRNESVSEPGEAIRCDAMLTLRLPYVGVDTAADKLYHGENVDVY